MLPLLSRPARLFRRAALFGLTYLALLVFAGVAETAGPRMAGSEDGAIEAGELGNPSLSVVAGGPHGIDDGPALVAAVTSAAALPRHASPIEPTRADPLRPALRAIPPARGPPSRA
ncbi:MAG: hypothetical protein JNM50_10035 [Chromatiales bacterium]|jgi:hypothetical protein|nr:hypothetical protein [Chromatiales bacterium]